MQLEQSNICEDRKTISWEKLVADGLSNPKSGEKWTEENARQHLDWIIEGADGRFSGLLMKEDVEVGFVIVSTDDATRTLYIDLIFIREEYRRRGFAAKALNDLVFRAYCAGYTFVALSAPSRHIGYYQSLGFVSTGETDYIRPKDVDFITYDMVDAYTILRLETGGDAEYKRYRINYNGKIWVVTLTKTYLENGAEYYCELDTTEDYTVEEYMDLVRVASELGRIDNLNIWLSGKDEKDHADIMRQLGFTRSDYQCMRLSFDGVPQADNKMD